MLRVLKSWVKGACWGMLKVLGLWGYWGHRSMMVRLGHVMPWLNSRGSIGWVGVGQLLRKTMAIGIWERGRGATGGKIGR